MHFKAYFTILFVIFSLVMASNALKDKDYHANYKSSTLEQKIEQMELLELSSSTPIRMPNIEALKKGLMIKSQIDLTGKAASIGKERMIPSSGNRDCEGLSQEDCEWLDYCEWISDSDNVEDSEGQCVDADWENDGGNQDCDDGYLMDCSEDGDCCPESWIGDGFADCEDQAWGCDLSCYDNDGNDCAGEGDGGGDDGNADDGGTGGDDGGSECVDCVGNNCTGYEQWIGDGICDEGEYGIFYNCLEFECDGGDCGFNSNGECESSWEDDGGDGGSDGCEDGYVDDCSGDGDCCPESWIGDGYMPCDGEDQPYGCDLTCYDNDGGDCEEGGDDGGNQLTCSEVPSDDCEYIDIDGDGALDCMLDQAGNCVDNNTDQECQNYDCMDQCYDGYENWLGDGWCDDGSWGLYFNCEEFDCDYGDCLDPTTGDCSGETGDDGGDFECSDLGYEDCMYYDFCEWISDSDDPNAAGECVDANWEDDGGNEGCSDDQVEDCSDDDCCPLSWIGDGFPDCEDQAYGCDLSCYDNDEGDCEEGGDDGGSNQVDVALILGDASGVPGGEVEVALSIESSEVVAGIQFTLQSSPADWASVYDFNINLSTDDCFEANFNSIGDGTVIGLIYSLSGCELEPSDESYQIATLSYEISTDAEFGSGVDLYFEEVIVAGAGGEQLNATGYSGIITIGMIGDVNHDGSIDVIDAVTMINFILMLSEPSESQYWAADINEDGALNVLDVVLLVDVILGD